MNEGNIKYITLKDIEEIIKEQEEDLETYSQYKDEFDPEDDYDTITNLIGDLDLDSIEFNAGFEQGYLMALRSIRSKLEN